MKLSKNNVLFLRTIFDNVILLVILYFVYKYSLDIQLIYPEWILDLYLEPFNRFMMYILLFIIANINIKYGILYFVFIIFLQIDIYQYIK
jgi:hypothetical protein